MSTLHQTLLATKTLLHVSATGAGLRLQTALWDTPGASAYLVGFFTPYARTQRWRDESRTVEFTRDEPLFLDKARKRPGSIFLIGADTMAHMLESGWGPDVADMLSEMRNLETRFWVMDRELEGKLLTCRDIKVPWLHQNLFEPLEGRLDVSSTELRRAGGT